MSFSNVIKSKVPSVALTLAGSASLQIPEEPMKQINYLCTAIHTIEWSGVLFFKINSGSIETQDLEMEVVEVYPMDKGTTGSTGYKFTPDVGKRHAELIKQHKSMIKIGMIHSHHNMNSYFSGTDMDELNENSENHKWYLSLVVNNKNEMVAKVGYRAETTVTKVISGPIKISAMETTEQTFLHFDVVIHQAQVTPIMNPDWLEKFSEINKPKAYTPPATASKKGAYGNQGSLFPATSNSFEEWYGRQPESKGGSKSVFETSNTLTTLEVLAIMEDEENLFEKLDTEDFGVIVKFIEAVNEYMKLGKPFLTTKLQVISAASAIIRAIPVDEDSKDELFVYAFSSQAVNQFISKFNLNLNDLYMLDLLRSTFTAAANSTYITSVYMKKKAAELCMYITDGIVELEEALDGQ